MATSIREICGFLDEAKLKYRVEEDRHRVVVFFACDNYRNVDGEPSVGISINVGPQGRYLGIGAARLYVYKEGPHLAAVLGACLYVSFATAFVQLEWDPEDGEIRATVEFPIEDAQLTSAQFHAALKTLLGVVDGHDAVIRRAIETGALEIPRDEKEEERERLRKVLEMLSRVDPKALAELMRKAGVEPKKPDGPAEGDAAGGALAPREL